MNLIAEITVSTSSIVWSQAKGIKDGGSGWWFSGSGCLIVISSFQNCVHCRTFVTVYSYFAVIINENVAF